MAYVEVYDDDTQEVCFSEANWYKGTNPGNEIVVHPDYYDAIVYNVHKIDPNVVVKHHTVDDQQGTDGLFRQLSLNQFKSRKSGTCKFVHLKRA